LSRPSSKRSARRRAEAFAPLECRIAGVLLGTLFLGIPLAAFREPVVDEKVWLAALLVVMAILGVLSLWFALFGSDRAIERFIGLSSDWEVAALLFGVAFPIAWLIRRFRR